MFQELRNRSLVVLVALLVSSTVVLAHPGMEHVLGTVTAVSNTSLTVETIQHKPVTVSLNSSTTFTHNEAGATLKDLKVGDRVVIHAKLSADKTLVGVVVKWGGEKPAHADTKK